jgi:GT2 family glycosyltransferase
MAEQRQFLFGHATAPAVLFLDDDVIVEPELVERLLRALRQHGIGFVGSAVLGLSYLDDVRPDEHAIEFWDGPVEPEVVRPGGGAWERARLHNAANLHHVAERHGATRDADRLYRVAWVGGCVLYDRAALEEAGGFGFWKDLPRAHVGEDVLAQLRVMARRGGAGLLPSGAYHLELPTTVEDRTVDAPWTF